MNGARTRVRRPGHYEFALARTGSAWATTELTLQVHQYRAVASACRTCALKPRCTQGQQRQLSVSWHDAAKRAAAALAGTPAFVDAARARRKVEARCAELERYIGLRRLRLRGLPRAAEQFLLAATAQNLKRLAAPPEA